MVPSIVGECSYLSQLIKIIPLELFPEVCLLGNSKSHQIYN